MNPAEGELKDMSLFLNSLFDLLKKVVGSEVELASATPTPQLDSIDKALTQATKNLSEASPYVPTPVEQHYGITPSSAIRRRPKPAAPRARSLPNGLGTSSPVSSSSRKRPVTTEKSPKRTKTAVPISVATPPVVPTENTIGTAMGMMSLNGTPEQQQPSPSASEDSHIMVEMYQISKETKKEQAAVFARTELVRLRYQEGWKMTGKCGNIKLVGSAVPFHPCVCCRSRLGKDAYDNEYFKHTAHGTHHHHGEDKDESLPVWWGRNNLVYKSVVDQHRPMAFSLGIDLPICEPCYSQIRESGFVDHGSFATAYCRCCLLPFVNAVCYRRVGVAGAPRHVPWCSLCTELPAIRSIIIAMLAKGLLEVDEYTKLLPAPPPQEVSEPPPPRPQPEVVFCESCGYHKTNSESYEWLGCALENCRSHICPRCTPPGNADDSDGGVLPNGWFCTVHIF